MKTARKPSNKIVNNENEVAPAKPAAPGPNRSKIMDGALKNGFSHQSQPFDHELHSICFAKQQPLVSPMGPIRRRCRSETTHYEHKWHNFRQTPEKVKPQLTNGTSFYYPAVVPTNGCKKVLQESTFTNNFSSANQRRDHSKANNFSNYHVSDEKRRLEPDIVDMRVMYDGLKLKNGHQYQKHFDYYRQQHKNNDRMPLCFEMNPRNLIFDTQRRRMRARSESEPHEIYTTQRNIQLMVNGRCNHQDDLSLKRSRDVAGSPPQASKTLSANTIKGTSKPEVAVMHNPEPQSLQIANKLVSTRLQNKSPKTSNNPMVNGRRSESPLLRKNATAHRISPSNNFVRQSPSPTLRKSQLQHQQRQMMWKTIANGSEERSQGSQDEECEEEEENDDINDSDSVSGDIDDVDESITDSEDNYKNHVVSAGTSATPKSLLAPTISTECVLGGHVQPIQSAPLACSLFPNVPPYLTFASHSDKLAPMPAAIHKQLKWKLTTITPVVVRTVLTNSGFRLLKKTNDWMGIWGKHMKSPCFKTLRHYQKINHLPGSFQIGRKDRVWRNLQTQMNRHGKKEFGFMPRTFIIPQDLKILRQVWQKYYQRNVKWIIKPPASARGTGIKVVNRWSQIPKRKPLIVQRYIDRPLLINGSKFDLRLYVLVTSMNPLRVYMHTDGLARFASVKYSEKADTLNDRYMHLTNYSINKMSQNYTKNEDATACKGHKWTIKTLWKYLSENCNVDVDRLWGALRNLVLRTVLAGEGPINAMTKLNVVSKYNCYELFGVDVILDSEYVPWLLEVNISPSLHSSSPLDLAVKGPLVTAVLNTAMYQIPPKIPLVQQAEILQEIGLKKPLCYDKRICVTGLTKEERLKHNQFIQKSMTRDEYLTGILENLTPDDVRCLLLTEDELARSAPLERIFPAPKTHKYLTFTENPRYYNRLLDAWEQRYFKKRADGIKLLREMCEIRVHLQVPPITIQKDSNDKPQCADTQDIIVEKSVVTPTPNDNKTLTTNLMRIMENQEPNLLQNGHHHHHRAEHGHVVVSPKSKISKITDNANEIHC